MFGPSRKKKQGKVGGFVSSCGEPKRENKRNGCTGRIVEVFELAFSYAWEQRNDHVQFVWLGSVASYGFE